MRLTISTNTQSTANYLAAADDIMNVFDNFGFTTDNPCVDTAELRTLIANSIRNSIEGNVNYVEAAEPDDDNAIALEELLEQIKQDTGNESEDPVGCNCEFCKEVIQAERDQSVEHFKKLFEDQLHKKCKCSCGCDDRRQPGE
jgi:hypothetical protein